MTKVLYCNREKRQVIGTRDWLSFCPFGIPPLHAPRPAARRFIRCEISARILLPRNLTLHLRWYSMHSVHGVASIARPTTQSTLDSRLPFLPDIKRLESPAENGSAQRIDWSPGRYYVFDTKQQRQGNREFNCPVSERPGV